MRILELFPIKKDTPVFSFPAASVVPGISPRTGFVSRFWFLPVYRTVDLFKRITFSFGLN